LRYPFIQAEKALYPVSVLCRLLQGVAQYLLCLVPAKESRRAAANRVLLAQIHTLHQQTRQRYGSPRLHQALQAHGFRVGRHQVGKDPGRNRLPNAALAPAI